MKHGEFMPPFPQERREWPRRQDIVRVAVTDLEDVLEQSYAGWVMDMSVGGMSISFDPQMLDVGNFLAVQPSCTPVRVEVRVKNAHKKAGQMHFGCEFVHPGEETLLLLQAPDKWVS